MNTSIFTGKKVQTSELGDIFVPLDDKFLLNLVQWRDHNEEVFAAAWATANSHLLLSYTVDLPIL